MAFIAIVSVAFVAYDLFGDTAHASPSKANISATEDTSASAGASSDDFSADALATGTSATPTPVVTSSSPAPATTRPTQAVHRQVGATAAAVQVAALDAGQPAGAVSVSETDLTTGVSFMWGASSGMVTASVVKLDILETMLLQHQQAGTTLSDSEDDDASEMMEDSDNDAADDLWNDVGSDPAITAANKTLGLTATVAGTDDYWGLTTTSAADQVKLLKELAGPSALDAASQSYALGLMRSVESDQDWGVSAVADANTQTALKNGWLNITDDNDLWAVNSVGLVTVHGQQIALAVMTQHQPDEDTGIDLVQKLAAAAITAVS